MCSFDQGPLPPPSLSTQIDTDVIHVNKWMRPSLSIFAYCNLSKTGRWEGLGTRLPIVQNNITAFHHSNPEEGGHNTTL